MQVQVEYLVLIFASFFLTTLSKDPSSENPFLSSIRVKLLEYAAQYKYKMKIKPSCVLLYIIECLVCCWLYITSADVCRQVTVTFEMTTIRRACIEIIEERERGDE